MEKKADERGAPDALEQFRQYYFEADMARLLGINVRTFRNWLSKGKDLPPILPGKRCRKEDWEKWELERARRPAGQELKRRK